MKSHVLSNDFVKYYGCLLLCLLSIVKVNAQSRVILEKDGDRYQLLANGKVFQIKGAGGIDQFKKFRELGGNSVRTWGVDELGRVLDEAHEHNLMVCAGIWLGHQRHGFGKRGVDA